MRVFRARAHPLCEQFCYSWVFGSGVEIADMTISMYQSSVEVFTQFLGSLSDLLDHAAVYAEARKIDPSILLHTRLYPNMYDLSRQVGEANRHAILACALLAGVNPPVFADTEPDTAELKARIAATIAFLRGLRPEEINGTGDKEVAFTFRNGNKRKFTGRSLLLTFSVPQLYLAAVLFAAISSNQVRRRAASGHFAFQLLESLPRLVLAFVDQPDRGGLGQRTADNRQRIFTDGLIHVIFAAILAADGPPEPDRRHRAGADLVVTVGLHHLGDDGRRFLDRVFFRLAVGFRLIEDAGDGGQSMIGRVTLTHCFGLSDRMPSAAKIRWGTLMPSFAGECG
jgi:uncharacterized protein